MSNDKFFENLSFDRGCSINISYRNHASFPPHWHSQIEIIVPLQEDYEVSIGSVSYSMHADDIAIAFPGAIHSIQSSGLKQSLILQFPPSFLTLLHDFNRYFPLFSRHEIITAQNSPELSRALMDILNKIVEINKGTSVFKEAAVYSLLLQFFMAFGEFCVETPDASSDHQQKKEYTEIIADACAYIAENLTKPISLEPVAQHVGYSRFHFSRIFNQYIHMPFSEFVTQMKIKKSEDMLCAHKSSITEVAFASGFGSLSTFNRIFKINKGCTPSEFRRLYVDGTAGSAHRTPEQIN
jgi:AraC-like DNA-binding protein